PRGSSIALAMGSMREMYRKDGGAFPDPILGLDWSYLKPDEPGPDELAREFKRQGPGRPGARVSD
ncbi:hypothetical protein, partial [Serratia marcescens]|uniref:hypothetical protein n=1 Tax=Serratia marcescens TaxID=615 RepID=UPI001953EEAF